MNPATEGRIARVLHRPDSGVIVGGEACERVTPSDLRELYDAWLTERGKRKHYEDRLVDGLKTPCCGGCQR